MYIDYTSGGRAGHLPPLRREGEAAGSAPAR